MYKYLIGMVSIGPAPYFPIFWKSHHFTKGWAEILSRHVHQWQRYQHPGFLWDTGSGYFKGSVSLCLLQNGAGAWRCILASNLKTSQL